MGGSTGTTAAPLPLGFLALAVGTMLLAALQLGWLDARDGQAVALGLIAFVAPLQLVACLMGFAGRDIVPATGMGVLAGTWATIALVTLTSPDGATSAALGALLLGAAVSLLLPAGMAAARAAYLPAIVMTGAALRFAVTGGYEISGATAWARAAGVIGLALAALAVAVAAVLGLREVRPRSA